MTKIFKSLKSNIAGAALVEFSLIFPILILMTTGLIEISYVLYQHNAAQKATQVGAELASTRNPIATTLSDCGDASVSTNGHVAGTSCGAVAGSSTWSVICNGGGGGNCDATAMGEIYTQMQKFYPNIQLSNLRFEFSGTGLGFVGRERPVPAITVTLENMQYNYIFFGHLLGFQNSTKILPTARTTVIAEDLQEGA